jgi:hypothetical protein
MEFHLEKQVSKIAHINLREEKHGEETVLAVDVKITADVPNDFLSYLKPTLKWSLYEKEPGQGELLPDDAHMPHLRHPELGVMGWAGEMPGAAVIIHGVKEEYDMEIVADVGKLKFEPKEGGTVALTFTAQLRPNPGQSAALVVYLGKDVKVSVRPREDISPPAE